MISRSIVMKQVINNSSLKRDPVRLLVQCGLLTALVSVGTFINIPIAGGQGFINLGDAVVHAAAYLIGGWHCMIVAAVGSAIPDIALGYTLYAPATVIIKALLALADAVLLRKIRFRSLTLLITGLIVPAGYFLYELLLASFGVWTREMAVLDLPWNMLQYAVCATAGSIVLVIFDRAKLKEKF